jgi:predicted transcriptional regulator
MRYPGIVSRTITTKTTNIDALKEMTAQDLDALVVTDDQMVKGVVEREQILSRLILAIAG